MLLPFQGDRLASIITQGVALGYGLLGFQPVSTVQVENHHAALQTGVRRGVLRDDPWAGVHPEDP